MSLLEVMRDILKTKKMNPSGGKLSNLTFKFSCSMGAKFEGLDKRVIVSP